MSEGIPKYITVRDNLRERAHVMQAGERLPAESDLCAQYQVSRITLRHAISDLIQDGLLVRQQGRGTFRTDRKAERGREVISDRISGFFRQQADLGNLVSTKVISDTVETNPDAARALDLPDDEPLIRLERLRNVDGDLKQYVVTFLSANRFPKISEHDFSEGSLYEFLENQYAVHLVRNDLVVRIGALPASITGYFHHPVGTPVLAMDSTVIDEFGSKVAYGTSLNTPDNDEIQFVIRSQKDEGPLQY